jgi:hypothetical protein
MPSPNDHSIALQADLSGNTITITTTPTSGNPAPSLGRGSGAHHFSFTLQDNTGLNVQFAGIDTQDNCPNCPPAAGDNSGQISGVQMHNNPPLPRNAAFTDNNNNSGGNGTLDVGYQWNFTCSDPNVTVDPFDPIIKNGGSN